MKKTSTDAADTIHHDDRMETRLLHVERHPEENFGIVNPPLYRASTVVFPSLAALRYANTHPYEGIYYGRHGTPTTMAFENAMAELEGADGAVVTSSGLAAIVISLLAFTRQGDHVLIADNVYGPTRHFAHQFLERFGVGVHFLDSTGNDQLSALLTAQTRVVFLESPGSLTFEMSDMSALAAMVHQRSSARVLVDNTWATPVYFRPLAHGADVCIHAATKYITGHSDAMLGVVSACGDDYLAIKRSTALIGNCPGAEECQLGSRGLRTLGVRLERHYASALKIADWLWQQEAVARVLYPPHPRDTGHQRWKRDFSGGSGLLGIALKAVPQAQVDAFVESLRLFGIGYSWGGYESLVLPVDPAALRTATPWLDGAAPLVRLHIGLDHPDDLIADLDHAMTHLRR